MTVPTFVDTSAIYALLDQDDANHAAAAGWIAGPGSEVDEILISHAYVIVEATALVHRRLGTEAVRALVDAFVPSLSLVYIDEVTHAAAMADHRASLARRTSFVDHVSFEVMRTGGIDAAFTFDDDFVREGFATVPG
jgi:uncharacterized protein